MSRIDKAKEFRREFEATKLAGRSFVAFADLDDEEVEALVGLYEPFKVGEALKPGDVRSYNGKLYEVIQGHTSQGDWTPDSTASLFKLYIAKRTQDGEEIIPDFKKPTGAHDSYKKGDKVMFDGGVYVSLIDNNAYSPVEYAQGWEKLD